MLSSLLPMILLAAQVAAIPIPNPNIKPKGFEQIGEVSAGLNQRPAKWNVERNELSECAPVTAILARGTIELGNVGSFASPTFFNALDLAIGAENVAVQAVDYPASIEGYLEGGDKGGAANLAGLAYQAATQ